MEAHADIQCSELIDCIAPNNILHHHARIGEFRQECGGDEAQQEVSHSFPNSAVCLFKSEGDENMMIVTQVGNLS